MTARTGRRRNAGWTPGRSGLLAAALALLVQVVAWAWMPAWLDAAGDAAATLEICTPDGYRIAVADAGPADPGTTLDPPHAAKATGSCPLCPLVGGLASPPGPAGLLTVVHAQRDRIVPPAGRIASSRALAAAQARAPPAA